MVVFWLVCWLVWEGEGGGERVREGGREGVYLLIWGYGRCADS